MKTAIFIQENDTQLVLTPENKFEETIIKNIHDGKQEVTIMRGSFYECRSGYFRIDFGRPGLASPAHEENSLIMRINIAPEVIK